jgi:hypothetical protein
MLHVTTLLIPLDLITLLIFGEEHKLWRSYQQSISFYKQKCCSLNSLSFLNPITARHQNCQWYRPFYTANIKYIHMNRSHLLMLHVMINYVDVTCNDKLCLNKDFKDISRSIPWSRKIFT